MRSLLVAAVVVVAGCAPPPAPTITRADLKPTHSGPPLVDPRFMTQLAGTRLIVPEDSVSGSVRGAFEYCIDRDGYVTDVRVVQSTTLPRYDQQIVYAIREWVFRPVVVDGNAIAVCSAVTIRFTQH